MDAICIRIHADSRQRQKRLRHLCDRRISHGLQEDRVVALRAYGDGRCRRCVQRVADFRGRLLVREIPGLVSPEKSSAGNRQKRESSWSCSKFLWLKR